MKVNRAGHKPTEPAPAANFTGRVRRDALVDAEAPGSVFTGLVTFEPGARTAWHVHPAGQILLVVAGRGWVQTEGGTRVEVFPGDSVWFAAHERHWHGATAHTAMTHIAVTQAVDGSAVTWLEHVTDQEYDPS